jgi:GAF domain-containing protein
MPFAAALRESLRDRDAEAPAEFLRGDSLEDVLNRHLIAVEQMGGHDVFTSVLLLSPDGKRLTYGAAPNVPASYVRASDFIEVGPFAGSCGAAAYHGRPVYSVDIEKDAVWGDYRDLALNHGYRSCWSTPIRNSDGAIIGTFAILHRTVGKPSREEIEAINMIIEHVAAAIMWSRNSEDFAAPDARQLAPLLRLVCDNEEVGEPLGRLTALAKKLHSKAADLDCFADRSESEAAAEELRNAADLSRKLGASIMSQIERITSRES